MTDKTMPITGGCMCGAIRYEATVEPQEAGYCHCRMCQKVMGNLFNSYVTFPSEAFRVTQGEPKLYKSSTWIERVFCGNCGTQVFDRYLSGNDLVNANIGSLDHPEDWPPTIHYGVESQIPWLTIQDDLPRLRTEDDPDFVAAKATAEAGEK